MPEVFSGLTQDLAGRESEFERLGAFGLPEATHRGLLLVGEPGIGKTTLWEAGVGQARDRGLRVLTARASEQEVDLSYVGLADLLEGVDLGGLPVPMPQLRALEVVLQRAVPGEDPPDPLAVSAGFTGILRALAAREPVLVAVDDVPSLDGSSLNVLSFAVKRVRDHSVRFLFARRPGEVSVAERVFEPGSLETLDVGPLSLGATRLLLARRLGLSVSRRQLLRVLEAARGNPMFALEIGRIFSERRITELDDLPVPDSVEDLLGIRVERLAAPTRRLLLATALSGNLRTSSIPEVVEPSALEDALDTGIVVVDADRVRASHPLLAAAAVKKSRPRERSELHLVLAAVAVDEVARARHLALATPDVDESLANRVAGAAGIAGARGATQEALVLWEHALRLTPADSEARPERVLSLAHHLAVAGEKERVTRLLSAEMEKLPAGSARARAWLIRPGGVVHGNDEIRQFLERALAESRGDPALHAVVLGNLSFNTTYICVERISEAESWARDALVEACRGEPGIQRSVLYALACARSLRGLPLDDVCARFDRLSTATPYVLATPGRIAGLRLVWRGEVEAARAVLEPLLAVADERGEAMGYAHIRMHLCELELRTGRFKQAEALLTEWGDPADRQLIPFPFYERFRALYASGIGLPDEARQWVDKAVSLSEAAAERWDWLEARRAEGLAALMLGDTEQAVKSLQTVWAHTVREGIDDPGTFPVAPDLVEALVERSEFELARTVCTRLRILSRQQQHPWGLATVSRCDAVVILGERFEETGVTMLEDAARAYATLGLRFDEGRVFLTIGRFARRHRKRALARRALGQAASIFDTLGSTGWAQVARAELDRVSGRRSTPEGLLTPAEEQVARIAAEGLSNKEIAARLVVSVYTVERHLKHVYAKLGIRSRSQLAARLRANDQI